MNKEVLEVLQNIEDIHLPSGPTYQRLQCLKASYTKNELEAIYSLTESHSPGLRFKTVCHHEKMQSQENGTNISPQYSSKDVLMIKCPLEPVKNRISQMLKYLEEMPEEWTLVQLTPQFNNMDEFNDNNDLFHTNPIHISVFKCGKNLPKPFLVTVSSPKDPVNGKPVQLAKEMADIIKGNKEALMSQTKQQKFKNQTEKMSYISRRQFIEDRLKCLITDIQNLWLKEWRCLLTGSYCDKSLDKKIENQIKMFFKDEIHMDISQKVEHILTSVVKCSLQLKLTEVKSVIQYCFPTITDKNIIRQIVHFLRNIGELNASKGDKTKKNPVILILHDTLDCFPWEMIDILQDEPVSRVPSLHFIYCLFKEHQGDIVNGHKILIDYDKGSYVVNPDQDLRNMEIRMMTFFNYWTPNWTGTSGYPPDKEEFLEILTSSDIFSYNGHGSGSHLISMEKVQKRHIKAVVLLFGCGSTKIKRIDPQVEMYGSYHMYLIARCPCVVGMLWEVTDIDTDVLTSDFISYWIPSEAPIHWKYVDKMKWKRAEERIDFVRNATTVEGGRNWEPELLRALCLAKKGLSYLGTKAACVVRGLPVKIQAKR